MKKRRRPRRRMIAYASTGSHQGPWVQMSDSRFGMKGCLAIYETYLDALRNAGHPNAVHKCEIFIEREPANAEARQD